MSRIMVLGIVIGWLCSACATTPMRFPGRYERATQVYVNQMAGFRLALPPPWIVLTTPQGFMLQHDLRPDQEKVLEAYDVRSRLGLVIVVQQGPVIDIADFVRQMRQMPEERWRHALQSPRVTEVRQSIVRQLRVNAFEAAEWTYTAVDTTAGQPTDMTVKAYIVHVGEHYVYLTFAVPSDLYQEARETMATVLATLSAA